MNQTVFAAAIQTLDKDSGSLEGTGAGSWRLGTVEESQGKASVDCRETDRGDVREEIMVGSACGGTPGSPRSKAILMSHA